MEGSEVKPQSIIRHLLIIYGFLNNIANRLGYDD
jgi:hypothetical protein